ncbi:alpha-2-macroglobulin-like protein 1 [Limosa lapponica baueri]|uniref:Alpha-2-macroglobulin-like protein 1 n=1 Tax=Limosa lapponica baueri TaxID=1758121 RepID=A0A2I0TC22_LIMLA|nr:alpha-2-macroglobulin-like protein 1 [Limosa lapponica baueri]
MLHIADRSHYMVVFPAVIHHSQEEKLCVHFSSLTEAVHLAVTLEVKTQNYTLVEQDVEKPGTFQCITFQPKYFTILFFISLVKFRIVNLDEDLKVIKNEDPEYNRIAEWVNVKSRHGIVDLSFPLASEAPLGVYTISVKQGMAEKTFRVDEYGAETMEMVVIPIATRMKSIEFINLHSFYKRGIPYTGKGSYSLGNDDEKDSSESHSGVEDSFHWLKAFYSESNSFLEIKARNDVMPCDQEQEVQVDYILDQNKLSSEADHIDFYYLVIAKGKILYSGEKQVPILQHESE